VIGNVFEDNKPVFAPTAPPLSQGFGGDTAAMILQIKASGLTSVHASGSYYR
jgi:hypothetical protein